MNAVCRIRLFGHRHLRMAEKDTVRQLKRINCAHLASDLEAQGRLSKHFLRSHNARCVAVWKAYRSLPWLRRRGKKSTLVEIANTLNVWSKSNEEAIVLAKKKGDDDYRLVVDFWIANRARQYLVLGLLEATAELGPNQYLTRGGVPEAIKRVAELMAEGYIHCIEIDIKSCYPSFRAEKMDTALPLKKEVINNVIMARDYNMVPGGRLMYLYGPTADDKGDPVALAERLVEARRGIPHGSTVSALVAEIVMASVLKALPGIGHVVNYADNTLVMAKTKEAALSLAKTVRLALLGHPVGPLTPYVKGEYKAGEAVYFLGHRLRTKATVVEISPSEKNVAKFCSELARSLKTISDKKASMRARRARARDGRKAVKSWCANFKLCQGVDERKQKALMHIAKALDCHV
jgi:hypothetical protein